MATKDEIENARTIIWNALVKSDLGSDTKFFFSSNTSAVEKKKDEDNAAIVSSISNRLSEMKKNKEMVLPNYSVSILISVFGVSVDDIRAVIDPNFYALIKKYSPKPSVKSDWPVIMPIKSKNSDSMDAYEAVLKSVYEGAKDKIWISEFLPGRGKDMMPEEESINLWMQMHERLFGLIEGLLEMNPNLTYTRIFRVPIDTEEDGKAMSKYYAFAISKTSTLKHMLHCQSRFPKQVRLFAAPFNRPMSYAIIDGRVFAREYYHFDIDKGPRVMDLDRASVHDISHSQELSGVFEIFKSDFEKEVKNDKHQLNLMDFKSFEKDLKLFFKSKSDRLVSQNLQSRSKLRLTRLRSYMESIEKKMELFHTLRAK